MKQSFYYVAAAMLLLAGCSKPFKKAENGVEYKIISNGKGDIVKSGEFLEVESVQRYKGSNKDTVLFSTKELSNQIIGLDSMSIPPVFFKIFGQVRTGDSLVIKQATDTIIKQAGGNGLPPFIKKGAHIISTYKIVNIYRTREAADSAFQKIMAISRAKDSIKAIEQLKLDDKEIAAYLSKNNIQASKTQAGTYVQIVTPGTGDAIDTSKVVKVFYTGKNLAGGPAFDSNKDPKFQHPEVLSVKMWLPSGVPGSVIKGWVDGLTVLKKGSKANLYIPSSLGYGATGAGGGEIKPNSNLLFEVEIADVLTREQAETEEMAKRKEMQDQQQKSMAEAQRAQGSAGEKK